MARNPVQFQQGISLNEFLSLYGTEEQCFDALYRWRWPNGFVYPNCGHHRGCQLTTHKLQQCYRCHRNGPRELDSAVSEIFLGFQAANSR